MNSSTALARGNIYCLLSQAYLYPGEEFFSTIKNGIFAVELEKSVAALLAVKDDENLRQCAETVLAELSKAVNSLSGMRSEYYRIFGHTISKEHPPYETQYGTAHLFQQTEKLSRIAGFYRAFGLEVKSVERLDHISVELEFMHFLCCKEAYAIDKNHAKEKLQICIEAQKKFLSEHLGKWVFAFSGLLKKKGVRGLYKTLAELTESFISFELAYLDVAPKELGTPELVPMPTMGESSCFSCSNDSGELSLFFNAHRRQQG